MTQLCHPPLKELSTVKKKKKKNKAGTLQTMARLPINVIVILQLFSPGQDPGTEAECVIRRGPGTGWELLSSERQPASPWHVQCSARLGEWLSAMSGRGPEVPPGKICCPFPSNMYAELRTQRPTGLNATGMIASTLPVILIITPSEGGCQDGCDLTVRVGQGKLRQSMS